MLLPSKVTSFKESDLYIALLLAKQLRGKKISPLALVQGLKSDEKLKSVNLSAIICALKMLYLLNAIELENGELVYVD